MSATRMGGFACTPSDMHPMNCDGKGNCVHCDRKVTYRGEAVGRATPNNVRDWEIEHDPSVCPLCDPDYDFLPNPNWRGGAG